MRNDGVALFGPVDVARWPSLQLLNGGSPGPVPSQGQAGARCAGCGRWWRGSEMGNSMSKTYGNSGDIPSESLVVFNVEWI